MNAQVFICSSHLIKLSVCLSVGLPAAANFLIVVWEHALVLAIPGSYDYDKVDVRSRSLGARDGLVVSASCICMG